jgi:TM2 domain-containing membrane protein YozV
MEGVPQALVIAGTNKWVIIFGIYDISSQLGVYPCYFWADVQAFSRDKIYASNVTKHRGDK